MFNHNLIIISHRWRWLQIKLVEDTITIINRLCSIYSSSINHLFIIIDAITMIFTINHLTITAGYHPTMINHQLLIAGWRYHNHLLSPSTKPIYIQHLWSNPLGLTKAGTRRHRAWECWWGTCVAASGARRGGPTRGDMDKSWCIIQQLWRLLGIAK